MRSRSPWRSASGAVSRSDGNALDSKTGGMLLQDRVTDRTAVCASSVPSRLKSGVERLSIHCHPEAAGAAPVVLVLARMRIRGGGRRRTPKLQAGKGGGFSSARPSTTLLRHPSPQVGWGSFGVLRRDVDLSNHQHHGRGCGRLRMTVNLRGAQPRTSILTGHQVTRSRPLSSMT